LCRKVLKEQVEQISYRGELFRKLTHLSGLIVPAGYYYFNISRGEALAILIPITLAFIIIDISRLNNFYLWRLLHPIVGIMIRDHEKKGDFTGATYILVTICLVIGLFSKPVAVAAIAFIQVGDSAAALIGRKFGRFRIHGKTIEGSLAFFAASVLIVLLIRELPLAVGVTGAAVAAVTEAVSFGIDDNATVPLASGLVMHVMSIFMV
jgi:dolichol kinase